MTSFFPVFTIENKGVKFLRLHRCFAVTSQTRFNTAVAFHKFPIALKVYLGKKGTLCTQRCPKKRFKTFIRGKE